MKEKYHKFISNRKRKGTVFISFSTFSGDGCNPIITFPLFGFKVVSLFTNMEQKMKKEVSKFYYRTKTKNVSQTRKKKKKTALFLDFGFDYFGRRAVTISANFPFFGYAVVSMRTNMALIRMAIFLYDERKEITKLFKKEIRKTAVLFVSFSNISGVCRAITSATPSAFLGFTVMSMWTSMELTRMGSLPYDREKSYTFI